MAWAADGAVSRARSTLFLNRSVLMRYWYETTPASPGNRHLQPLWRVLPLAPDRPCPAVKPHQLPYLRERGLKESDGYFLVDAPCRHLHEEATDSRGVRTWGCTIYEKRPATCRDYCGRTLSGGKRYYVLEGCTMADSKRRDPGSSSKGGD
jgi:hypothetical protein